MEYIINNPMASLSTYDHNDLEVQPVLRVKSEDLHDATNNENKQKLTQISSKATHLQYLNLDFSQKMGDNSFEDLEYFKINTDQLNEDTQTLTIQVQRKSIDYELKKNQMEYFLQLLGQFQQITLLSINFYVCQRIEESIQALSEYANFPNIKGIVIKLQGSQIKEEGIANLTSLISHNSQLIFLHISFSYNFLGEQETQQELVKMFKSCSQLQKLVLILNYCNLQNEGAVFIMNQLLEMKSLKYLALSLERNNIRSDSDEFISQLKKFKQLIYFNLSFSMNHILNKRQECKNNIFKLPNLVYANPYF